MISPLVKMNGYTALTSGVFARPDAAAEELAYSDGDAEEEYIYRALTSAQDLSSLSDELRGFERDWASECHLSSKRANVFRGLDFSDVSHVLEIGSGCGAITRFLGEQDMAVDAVEGSMRRAEITRLRCRGLDNVTVIQADFNTLALPEGEYDLALLTGVLEYAGKFSAPGEDPTAAAVAMLGRIIRCLKPGGTLLVAIENRIGFKYLAGAGEDHFSRPWVGVSDYPDCADPQYLDKQGIMTWDRSQWRQMLAQLDGISSRWYYPFPDYKLATSLLSEDFIQHSSSAWSCLSRVRSRDYTAVWHSTVDEQLFWQTAAAAGSLEEMANSFVLVLTRGGGKERCAEPVPFDFVHFSGHGRRAEYRVKVVKKRGQDTVTTTRLNPGREPDPAAAVIQHLEEEPYFAGQLLAVHWLNVLRVCSASATFERLLQQYYQYLVAECDAAAAERLVDLLPFNIIVGVDGSWHSFDQEWQIGTKISPQFILFRAVFYFFLENKELLQPFCTRQSLRDGWAYVRYCLDHVLGPAEYDLGKFVRQENEILQAISLPESFSSVESILDTRPERAPDIWSWEKTSVVWGTDAVIAEPVSSSPDGEGQRIVFSLPPEACSSDFIQLRLGIPEHQIGKLFSIRCFALYGCRPDGGREKIMPAEEGQVMPPLMQLTGLLSLPVTDEGIFVVDEKEPQVLHFLFAESCGKEEYTALECEVVLAFSSGVVMQAVADMLIEKKQQLSEIEQSRAWQMILKIRQVKEKILSLLGR